ncbi:MAG: hypothetical protein ACI3Z7_03325 [Candidatus Aphodosoma sp.]
MKNKGSDSRTQDKHSPGIIAKLGAENERIRKDFPDAGKKGGREKTKALAEEKQKAEPERDRA